MFGHKKMGDKTVDITVNMYGFRNTQGCTQNIQQPFLNNVVSRVTMNSQFKMTSLGITRVFVINLVVMVWASKTLWKWDYFVERILDLSFNTASSRIPVDVVGYLKHTSRYSNAKNGLTIYFFSKSAISTPWWMDERAALIAIKGKENSWNGCQALRGLFTHLTHDPFERKSSNDVFYFVCLFTYLCARIVE